jgi:hypothetical protein
MTDTKEVNPEDYPHRLAWEEDHVYLVTRDGVGQDERRDLGASSAVKDAYTRWHHLRQEHGQEEANIFLWGVMTGMSIAIWEEIDQIVKGARKHD